MLSITQGGYTPLITAAESGKYDVVIELLSLGSDYDAQDNVSLSFNELTGCISDYNEL